MAHKLNILAVHKRTSNEIQISHNIHPRYQLPVNATIKAYIYEHCFGWNATSVMNDDEPITDNDTFFSLSCRYQ